jgi:hypothetical protein
MYKTFELTLWTDEMVFARSALQSQYEDYCKSWRKTFIKYGAHVGGVYLPAIQALRETIRKIDQAMPPK